MYTNTNYAILEGLMGLGASLPTTPSSTDTTESDMVFGGYDLAVVSVRAERDGGQYATVVPYRVVGPRQSAYVGEEPLTLNRGERRFVPRAASFRRTSRTAIPAVLPGYVLLYQSSSYNVYGPAGVINLRDADWSRYLATASAPLRPR